LFLIPTAYLTLLPTSFGILTIWVWEVVNELFEGGDAERPFARPEFFTRQFAADYRKHLRSLAVWQR